MTDQAAKGRRLYEDIVQEFSSLIRQGVLKPGERLPSERVLADQLQVSRSSVREALRSLELQGLVISKRGSGTFINTDNLESMVALLASTLTSGADTLKHIFEMRHMLEPQIAALAAQRANKQEVAELESILEEQVKEIADGGTGVDSDTAFHFAMASATHNSALVKVISAVEDILRRSRNQSLQEPGRPQRSLASHREILGMIHSGDAAGARRAMEYHLTTVEPENLTRDEPTNKEPSAINSQEADSANLPEIPRSDVLGGKTKVADR
tara:strand:- start:91 stop:897 length:807 start_codon:yes stop_codon:yes gene_type:complete